MNVSQRSEQDSSEIASDAIRVGSIAIAIYECVSRMTRQLLMQSLIRIPPQLLSHPACGMAVLEVTISAKPNKVGSRSPTLAGVAP